MLNRTILVVLIALGIASAQTTANAQQGELVSRINDLRASLGLSPYRLNGALSTAAASHAQWMVNNQQISHTQTNGSTPRTRAATAGYGSQFVSENIYGGTNATVDSAWTFWINSPIHYRGLTNPNYEEVGVGVAYGDWGNAYVLLFGNITETWNAPTGQSVRAGGDSSASNSAAAALPPPSYVVGVDALGHLMHEIQPGDTLGDIALQYGYTWDDLPYMMEINELDPNGARALEVGAVFLVPPHDGTYTPTPGGPPPTATPTAEPDESEPGSSVNVGIITSTPQPLESESANVGIVTSTPQPAESESANVGIVTSTPQPTVTATPTHTGPLVQPSPTQTPQAIAEAQTITTPAAVVTTNSRSTSQSGMMSGRTMWLMAGIGLQVILIVGAGIELVLKRMRG